MGEVISKKAARDKIIGDVEITLAGAEARAAVGGPPWAEAAPRLGPPVALYRATEAKLIAAQNEARPLSAAVAAENLAADDLIRRVSDDVWNTIGRPANDPFFELLFPHGTALYVDAPVADQPDLMGLLADLLASNIDARLAAVAVDQAAAIRAAAQRLEAAVEAARKPLARVALYSRTLTAIARSAQVELARVKRLWRAHGLSEADIHAVIPDRPRSYGVTPKTPIEADPGTA